MPAVATLVALTQEAIRALGGRDEMRIVRFPFRVGRESRSPNSMSESEQSHVDLPVNDVSLIEPRSAAALLHISRKHFAIERIDSQFFLVDRGSACGTIVAGQQIGGDRLGGRSPLRHGDLVVVGTARSPYVFRFEMPSEFHRGHDAEHVVVDADRRTSAPL